MEELPRGEPRGRAGQHSTDAARARWRKVAAVMKLINQPRARQYFSFTSRQLQPSATSQKLRVAQLVSRAGMNFVRNIRNTTLEEQPLLPLQHPADSGSSNSLPESVVDVDPDLSPSRLTAEVDDDDQIIKQQQERCIKYSQKALGFAIPTFIGYAVSGSSTGHTVFTMVSMAAFFVAICSDFFSLKMKPKWSCTLVYVSWFHLVLMTTLIFVSLNKVYGWAVLIVPVMIGIAFLQHKLSPPPEHQRNTGDDGADKELDDMFDLSALILNWGSLVTAVISIVRRIISGSGNHRTVRAAGFLFFFTVIVGLYLMMVTTVRHAALTLHAKYLGVLLIGLVVGTLITTVITSVSM